MYTYRSIVALTLVATAAACSGTDVTRPGLDASDLTLVANRSSATSASSITITPATATVAVGGTLTLGGSIKSATGVDLTATLGAQATLTSSDTTIATVSKTGVVTGVRAGTATITAKLGTLSSSSTITVGSGTSASSITITPATATLAVGSTLTLGGSIKSATGVDLTATLGAQAILASSDTTIATVSKTGIVTGVRAGTTTIIAKLGTLSSSSTITVTAAAPTPTPPMQGGSPVSSLSMTSDNFSEYANTAAFLNNVSTNIGGTGSPATALYNDGANPGLAAIDNTVLYNGHQTLKYNQPGGEANTPELWVDFANGKTLKVMWLRAKIRFSPGFTTTGTLTNSANAYKLLGWGWNTYDGSGRVEITNTTQYQLYWNIQAKNTGTLIGGGNYAMGGNITTEWTDGGWYDYILEVNFSQAMGVTRLWRAKDGQTPVLVATSADTMFTGQGALPQLTGAMLGLNFNQTRAASQTQALWYGQWEVIDGVQHPDPYGLGVQ